MSITAMVTSSAIELKTSYYKKHPTMWDFLLAGVTGIEPVNGEFRVHCLTAWLHPNVLFIRVV